MRYLIHGINDLLHNSVVDVMYIAAAPHTSFGHIVRTFNQLECHTRMAAIRKSKEYYLADDGWVS